MHRDVHRVTGLPGDDRLGEGVAQIRPAGPVGHVLLRGAHPRERIGDGAVAGTAAKISLEGVRKVGALNGIQGSGGHDHAGSTEAALECLRIQKGPLYRVQLAVPGQAFDCRHFPAGSAERGHEAGMHRGSVDPDGAGAAIAGIAALFDAETAVLAQEGAQALARFRPGFEPALIDAEVECAGGLVGPTRDVVHAMVPGRANSARICSAKWNVRWRL